MSPVLKLIGLLCAFAVAFSLVGLLSIAWDWLTRPKAPAYFIGWQEVQDGRPFALYNLTRAIPGHPCGSTVSMLTLENAGYRVRRPRLLPPKSSRKSAGLFFARMPRVTASVSMGSVPTSRGGKTA